MHLFDKGWNELRETIFANQKRLGVIPQDAKLTPWPDKLLKKWDDLNADEKKMFIRQVEVYAAYLAYTDHEIGRVIQAVEDMGKLDNTLIIYISGDNGSSAEGTLVGTPNEVAMFNGVEVPVEDQLKYFYDAWGTDRTYNHMASAGPGPSTRRSVGPSRSPRTSAARGRACAFPGPATSRTWAASATSSITSLTSCPTILEACGIRAPEEVDGIKQAPIEGVSFAYTFDKANANAPSQHKTQYFEMMGDHAIYHEGWIASTKVIRPPWEVLGPVNQDPFNNCTWELYDLSKDWTQYEDVAAKYPEKLKEMKDLFAREARKYQVLPLDASVATRLVMPRPNITAGRSEFVYTQPLTGIPQGDSPLAAELLLHHHGRHRSAGRRRRGHAAHLRRPLRRLRFLPAQGQARVPLEPRGPEAHPLGRPGGACAGQAHPGVRLQVRRPRHGHAGLQQPERHRPRRHGRAQGGRQGSRHAEDGAHASRSSSSGTRPSISARIPARPWTTRTTRCRSPSPASSTS